MARYPKRQKVKRYRRSFYTREMRLKKGIGIAVLVVAVLAAAWVAAPHVLDWATHTWYTVVRDRDLSASSAVSESASSGAQSRQLPRCRKRSRSRRSRALILWRACGQRWM